MEHVNATMRVNAVLRRDLWQMREVYSNSPAHWLTLGCVQEASSVSLCGLGGYYIGTATAAWSEVCCVA